MPGMCNSSNALTPAFTFSITEILGTSKLIEFVSEATLSPSVNFAARDVQADKAQKQRTLVSDNHSVLIAEENPTRICKVPSFMPKFKPCTVKFEFD
jgi:hypothetical protein